VTDGKGIWLVVAFVSFFLEGGLVFLDGVYDIDTTFVFWLDGIGLDWHWLDCFWSRWHGMARVTVRVKQQCNIFGVLGLACV